MGLVFLIIMIFPAVYGVYMIIDYLRILLIYQRFEGEVVGFLQRKNKGQVLPVFKIEIADETFTQIAARRIDEIGYFISPAQKGEVKNLLVKIETPADEEEKTVAVYDKVSGVVFGYLPLVFGVLFLLPFFAALGFYAHESVILGQVIYVSIFAVVTGGGWCILKLIQRYY